jgi:hypothetical protein
MLWSICMDAAGAKRLGYDPFWPRRWDSSARQNGPAIPMPCGGRLPASGLSLRPPSGMGIGWLFRASRGRLWYMLYHVWICKMSDTCVPKGLLFVPKDKSNMGGYVTINQVYRVLYGNPIENDATTHSPPLIS